MQFRAIVTVRYPSGRVEFSQVIISKNFDKLNVKLNLITTPLDTKKYLFKDVYSSYGSGISIEKSSEHRDRMNLKSKRI